MSLLSTSSLIAIEIALALTCAPRLVAGDCYLTDVHTFGSDVAPKTPVRPLTVLAFGTSITWGDGLHQRHTFRYLVSGWLAQTAQRGVQLWTFAHSDSYLVEIEGPKEYSPDPTNGALNGNYPTVDQQIDCAANQFGLAAADLILVEGCANEVDTNGKRLILPGTDPEVIRRDTQDRCSKPMQRILSRLLTSFPNSVVGVSGYYPLFSVSSDFGGDRALRRLRKYGATVFPPPSVEPKGTIKDRLVAISDAFYQTSKQALSATVAVAAAQWPGRVFYAPLPEKGGTVDPGWAYGAKDTHQWRIPIPYLAWVSSIFVSHPDEEFRTRNHVCLSLYKNPLDVFLCQTNTGFHPNIKGAQAYSTAIETAIPTPLLDRWKSIPSR